MTMTNRAFANLPAAEPQVRFSKGALRIGNYLLFRSYREKDRPAPEVWKIASVHRASPGGYIAAIRADGSPVLWSDKLVLQRADGMSKIIGSCYARTSALWWALTLPSGG